MKKMYFLMLLLLFLGTASMNAQVKIGNSTADPHTGAVLDLKNTGVNKGLLLPNVALGSDLGVFVLDENSENGFTKENATGMLVYNTTDSKVYFWNGSIWALLSSHGTTTPEITLSSIVVTGTPTTMSYTAGQSFDPVGLTVTGINSDDSRVDIPVSECTYSPNPLTAGTTQVTVSYNGKTAVVPVAILVANEDGSTTMHIGNNDYKTYVYKTNGGSDQIWMVQNSKEGTSTSAAGSNGYYYTWEQATQANNACPEGWRLPTPYEFDALKIIVGSDKSGLGKWWNNDEYGAFAGEYDAIGRLDYYHIIGWWWTTTSPYQTYTSSGILEGPNPRHYNKVSVRCVNNQ